MPGRNAQGPLGQGPMTGRGFGPCCDGTRHGKRGGRAFRGAGRDHYGFGQGYLPEISNEDKKEILSERKAYLERELEDLQKSIDEL